MIKKILPFLIITIFSYFIFSDKSFKKDELIIASSMPLSGIMQPWGEALNSTIKSYFEYANENILDDKKLQFKVLDDKYEPNLTFENIENLYSKNDIFLFYALVGTPTVKRVIPLFQDNNIPLFASFSGASFLRDRNFENIINFRASYKDEIENLIDYILNSKKLKNISIFYQNDNFGEEGYTALKEELKKRDLILNSSGTYKRNTLSISHAFNKIKASNPEVIFLIGSYKANTLFIEKALKDESLKNTIFCTISFADANSMVKELKKSNSSLENIIFSQVVPNYLDKNSKTVNEYLDLMEKNNLQDNIGFLSFEAFLSSKILVEAIKNIDGKISRNNFFKSIEKIDNNIFDNLDLNYKNGQLQNKTYLFEYKNNNFFEITR